MEGFPSGPPALELVSHSAPGWWFNGCVAFAAAGVMWAVSAPGFAFFPFLMSGGALALLGLVWLIRVIGWGIDRHRGRSPAGAAQFLVAPVLCLVAWGLIAIDAPLQARWLASRSSFEAVVNHAPPASSSTDWIEFEAEDRIGLYRVRSASRVRDGVIFYEANGALFDDAGFAYLPTGPFPELDTGSFESPQFRSLGGGWYAWTASW